MTDYSTWTTQRLFNKIAKHLLTQNAKAFDKEADFCICYDKQTGRRCAFGCLIAKQDYLDTNRIKPDGEHVLPVIIDQIGHYSLQYSLVVEMQICHDDIKVSRWPRRLRAIAKKFDLVVPEYLRKDVCGK